MDKAKHIMTSLTSTHIGNPLQSPQRKGRAMERDNQGYAVDFNVVMGEWWTTDQAGDHLGIGRAAITYLCREGKLRAYQVVGRTWRIEPESVKNYVPEKPGRKPKE